MTPAEHFISEIEFFIRCDVGEANILEAFKTKPDTLTRRLRRAGRPDLIPRIFPRIANTLEERAHGTEWLNIAYNRKASV